MRVRKLELAPGGPGDITLFFALVHLDIYTHYGYIWIYMNTIYTYIFIYVYIVCHDKDAVNK